MTKNDTIDKLIDRLNELQVEQADTIRRIAELRKEEEESWTVTTEKEAHSVDSKPEVVEIPTLSTKVRKDSDNYYWVDAPNGVANEIFTENTRVHITNRVTPSKKAYETRGTTVPPSST